MAYANNYANLTGVAGTILSPAACTLHTVTINNVTAGSVALYDGTSTAGTLIATITAGTSVPASLLYDVQLKNGLFANVTVAGNFTVTWG